MLTVYPFFLQGEVGDVEPETGTVGNAFYFGKLPFFTVAVDSETIPTVVASAVYFGKLPFFTVSVSE